MTEQELKKEQFIAKAMENKEKFAIHKRLIEENLCIGGKMYIEDLKVFAERQVVDNQLLLNLMEYAESFSKEYHKLQMEKLKKVNDLPTAKDYLVKTNYELFTQSEQNVIGKTMVAYANYIKAE